MTAVCWPPGYYFLILSVSLLPSVIINSVWGEYHDSSPTELTNSFWLVFFLLEHYFAGLLLWFFPWVVSFVPSPPKKSKFIDTSCTTSENGDIPVKTAALKKVIQLILNGERLPGILMTVIRFVMPLEDHTIKKLLLVFWEIVPKTTSDGKLLQQMILVCDAYRKVSLVTSNILNHNWSLLMHFLLLNDIFLFSVFLVYTRDAFLKGSRNVKNYISIIFP